MEVADVEVRLLPQLRRLRQGNEWELGFGAAALHSDARSALGRLAHRTGPELQVEEPAPQLKVGQDA